MLTDRKRWTERGKRELREGMVGMRDRKRGAEGEKDEVREGKGD